MSRLELINPVALGAPSGYSNGVVAPPGSRLLFIAGQVGWNEAREIAAGEFVAQFEQALANVLAVLREAGGEPWDLVRLRIYVTDRKAYLRELEAVGRAYRRLMGSHYPAMALVEVSGLVEHGACVEIEGTAALPPEGPGGAG